jgi:hypothetical protein
VSAIQPTTEAARTSKYFERINDQRLNVSTLNFNHCHLVAIDRKNEVGVAGNGQQAEPVAVTTIRVISMFERLVVKLTVGPA